MSLDLCAALSIKQLCVLFWHSGMTDESHPVPYGAHTYIKSIIQRMWTRGILWSHPPPTRGDAKVSVGKIVLPPLEPPTASAIGLKDVYFLLLLPSVSYCAHAHTRVREHIYIYSFMNLQNCRREMDLPPEKHVRVCLACKGENGRSNVAF